LHAWPNLTVIDSSDFVVHCIRSPVADIKYFSVFHLMAGHVTGEVARVNRAAQVDQW